MEGLKELTAGRNISETVTDIKRERGGETNSLIDSFKYLLVKTFCMCHMKKPLIPYLKLLTARHMDTKYVIYYEAEKKFI